VKYNFTERYHFSEGAQQEADMYVLRHMIPDCQEVRRSDPRLDRLGVDYVAVLQGGREIGVDAKHREDGCSRYWSDGPELALETASVIVQGKMEKIGWTLDSTKLTELVLFMFEPTEHNLGFPRRFSIAAQGACPLPRTVGGMFSGDSTELWTMGL